MDALIFDCDGVLVDSETISIAVEREMLSGWGLNYPFETFVSRFVGLHNRDFHAALRQDAVANGNPLPDDFAEQLQTRIWQRFETDLVAIGGVMDVVAAFAGAKAVASSSEAPKLVRKLELTGLHRAFAPHIYSSDLVENGKPAPDLFLLASDRIGALPEACVVIEDSVNGVKAARAAGMMVWGFTGGGHADDGLRDRLVGAGAHRVFASHHELANALRG